MKIISSVDIFQCRPFRINLYTAVIKKKSKKNNILLVTSHLDCKKLIQMFLNTDTGKTYAYTYDRE